PEFLQDLPRVAARDRRWRAQAQRGAGQTGRCPQVIDVATRRVLAGDDQPCLAYVWIIAKISKSDVRDHTDAMRSEGVYPMRTRRVRKNTAELFRDGLIGRAGACWVWILSRIVSHRGKGWQGEQLGPGRGIGTVHVDPAIRRGVQAGSSGPAAHLRPFQFVAMKTPI